MIINKFEETMLPITEFRIKMTQIIENLENPKVLMNRDKPKAVLVPYEVYKAMEIALEDQMDEIMAGIAESRVNDSAAKYLESDEFWKKQGI